MPMSLSTCRPVPNLLSLPAELRLQIYTHLTPAQTIPYPIPHNTFLTSLTHRPPPLPALLVCRALTAELLAHFFARAGFALRTSAYATPAFLALAARHPALLARVRNLEIAVHNRVWPRMAWMWTAPLDLLDLLDRHLPALRTLKVSWDDADGRSKGWRKPRFEGGPWVGGLEAGWDGMGRGTESDDECDGQEEMLLEPLRRWEGRVRFVLGNVVARERGEEEVIRREVMALDGMFVSRS